MNIKNKAPRLMSFLLSLSLLFGNVLPAYASETDISDTPIEKIESNESDNENNVTFEDLEKTDVNENSGIANSHGETEETEETEEDNSINGNEEPSVSGNDLVLDTNENLNVSPELEEIPVNEMNMDYSIGLMRLEPSIYNVTIPKKITLDTNKKSFYSIKVEGDIAASKQVCVVPVDGITDTEVFDFYMVDQANVPDKKANVVAEISQAKFYWSREDALNSYEETNNYIIAEGLSAGNWQGTFQMGISIRVDPEHIHNYIGEITTEPTCTELGEKTYTCDCDESYTEEVPANGHSYDSGTVTTEAACTSTGVMTYTCTVCGVTRTETIAELGHNFSSLFTIDKEATCTEEGSKSKHCTRSGCTEKTEVTVIPATGHSYGEASYEWTSDYTACTGKKTCSACGNVETASATVTNAITTATTCTTAGTRTYTATFSNTAFTTQTKTESISAIGHNYGAYSTTKAATCTEDGSKKRTCSVCGNVDTAVITKLGHSYASTFTIDKVATCTEAGSKSKHCTRSGCTTKTEVTAIPATGHSYGAYTTTKAATCTEDGSKKRTCSTCGNVDTAVITKLGHSYASTFTIDKAATCTEAGSKSKHCTRSGCTAKSEVTAIPATGHSYGTPSYTWATNYTACTGKRTCSTCGNVETASATITNAVTTAATCTTAGTRTYTARFSNTAFATQTKTQSISATGHSYGAYSTTKNANCTEDGSKKRTCSVCGNVDTAVITKLGHSYASTFTVDKAATCTAAGSKSKHCTRSGCTAKSEVTAIPATGHSYGTPSYTWATNYTSCTGKRTCSTCGNVETASATITNAVTTAATCTTAGTRTYTARFSNTAFATQTKTQSIPATGHSYGAYTTTKNATCTEDGSKKRTCSVCGNVDTAVITKLGHSYASTFTVDKAATCTEAGSKSKHCTRSGCTEKSEVTAIPATGHNYGVASYTWSGYTACTGKRTCSTCGNVESASATITNAVTTVATCTTAGTRTYTARFSNTAFATQTKTQSISATGHSYGAYTTTKNANCTEDGSKKRTCSVCGNVDTAVITKLGHSYASTFTVDKAATCTAAGSKSKHCTRSGCTAKSEVTTIPATGHSYGAYTTTKAATCTEDGSKKRTCSVCGNVDTAVITKLGHSYASTFTVDKAATCTAAGSKSKHCTRSGCTAKTEVTVIPAGHNYVNHICTKCGLYEPGLYNADNNLVVSWEISGIDISKNYGSSTYKTDAASGYSVLQNYPTATKVVIPSNVTSISNGAFFGCTSLTSITIPSSVTSIGEYAFFACTSLTSINIPSSVTSIGNQAFRNCSGLTNITIPSSVTSIGNWTFVRCSSLTSITIPNSVTSIDYNAFQECTGLTSITIPSSVTSIGTQAFYKCSSLTNVNIQGSVTNISQFAFYNCSSLTNITIPSSVTSIENRAFYGCNKLTTVNYKGTQTQWNAITIGTYNEPLINATKIYNYTG